MSNDTVTVAVASLKNVERTGLLGNNEYFVRAFFKDSSTAATTAKLKATTSRESSSLEEVQFKTKLVLPIDYNQNIIILEVRQDDNWNDDRVGVVAIDKSDPASYRFSGRSIVGRETGRKVAGNLFVSLVSDPSESLDNKLLNNPVIQLHVVLDNMSYSKVSTTGYAAWKLTSSMFRKVVGHNAGGVDPGMVLVSHPQPGGGGGTVSVREALDILDYESRTTPPVVDGCESTGYEPFDVYLQKVVQRYGQNGLKRAFVSMDTSKGMGFVDRVEFDAELEKLDLSRSFSQESQDSLFKRLSVLNLDSTFPPEHQYTITLASYMRGLRVDRAISLPEAASRLLEVHPTISVALGSNETLLLHDFQELLATVGFHRWESQRLYQLLDRKASVTMQLNIPLSEAGPAGETEIRQKVVNGAISRSLNTMLKTAYGEKSSHEILDSGAIDNYAKITVPSDRIFVDTVESTIKFSQPIGIRVDVADVPPEKERETKALVRDTVERYLAARLPPHQMSKITVQNIDL
eukprot:Filipodium_phascolosomae@DN1976_c0_g1_i2.p1